VADGVFIGLTLPAAALVPHQRSLRRDERYSLPTAERSEPFAGPKSISASHCVASRWVVFRRSGAGRRGGGAADRRLVSSVMERKIIVGYDGSPGADDALMLGRRLGELADRPLLLVACCRDDRLRAARTAEARDLLEYPQARHWLDHAPVGADVERRAIRGRSPAAGLSMLAEEQDAVAIVVGSAHHAAAGGLLTRGVARELFAGSPCSVAAAPRGYRDRAPERLTRIIAAYVETDEGLDALRIAESLAHAGHAALRVVSVVDAHDASGDASCAQDSAFAERERALDTALRGLANTVAVDGAALEGDPVGCLLEQAAFGADLIVTGSRGLGVVRQVALGSVSSRLVERSTVPLLVVPRGGDRDLVAARIRHPVTASRGERR